MVITVVRVVLLVVTFALAHLGKSVGVRFVEAATGN